MTEQIHDTWDGVERRERPFCTMHPYREEDIKFVKDEIASKVPWKMFILIVTLTAMTIGGLSSILYGLAISYTKELAAAQMKTVQVVEQFRDEITPKLTQLEIKANDTAVRVEFLGKAVDELKEKIDRREE